MTTYFTNSPSIFGGCYATHDPTVSQVVVVPPPVVTAAPDVGHKGRRKRHYVEIDGQYFEVKNHDHAVEILTKLHEAAQEAAPVQVKQAMERAVAPVIPRMAVVKPDYSKEFTQQLQAQVDAANARIAQVYHAAIEAQQAADTALAAQIVAREYRRIMEDEDDIATLMSLGLL